MTKRINKKSKVLLHQAVTMALLGLTMFSCFFLWLISDKSQPESQNENSEIITVSPCSENLNLETSTTVYESHRASVDLALLENNLKLLEMQYTQNFGTLCEKSIHHALSLRALIMHGRSQSNDDFQTFIEPFSDYIINYKQILYSCLNENTSNDMTNSDNKFEIIKGILNIILSNELFGFYITQNNKIDVFFNSLETKNQNKQNMNPNDITIQYAKEIKLFNDMLTNYYKTLASRLGILFNLQEGLKPKENPQIYINTFNIITELKENISILPAFQIISILTYYYDINVVDKNTNEINVSVKKEFMSTELFDSVLKGFEKSIEKCAKGLIDILNSVNKIYNEMQSNTNEENIKELNTIIKSIEFLIYGQVLRDFRQAFEILNK